ncbi:MAG: histidine phosphatase family protein [Anaerolineales bacterium]
MPLFLLIRHGENDYVKTGRLAGRTPGVHLNERGRQQAAELAEALRDVPIAALYASPLERAVETAQPIAQARGLEIHTLPGLMDTDIGEWQGAELKKLYKLPEWKTVQQAPSRFRFPGGESFAEQQVRLVSEVERLTKLHAPHEVVALVFHADPIKMVVAYYLGMPLDHFQRLSCNTASVTALHLSERGANLVKHNLTPPFKLDIPQPPRKKEQRGLFAALFGKK